MLKRSRYLKQISFAVSLLTASMLSISCQNPSLTDENETSTSICDRNAFVPILPYSNAKLSEAELNEDYQLVFVSGRALLRNSDEIIKFGKKGLEQLFENSRKIPIDKIDDVTQLTYQLIRQSGAIDDFTRFARKTLPNTEIQVKYHQPIIDYGENRIPILIAKSVENAIPLTGNYNSQKELADHLQRGVNENIDSIVSEDFSKLKDVPPSVEETVKSLLKEQSARIAYEASRIATTYYCNR